MEKVLSEIHKFMPPISFDIVLFDQTEVENEKRENNEDEMLKKNKMKNIELRLRQLKIGEIDEIIEKYNQDLKLLHDPKGRIQMLNTLRYMNQSSKVNNNKARPFTPSFYTTFYSLQEIENQNKAMESKDRGNSRPQTTRDYNSTIDTKRPKSRLASANPFVKRNKLQSATSLNSSKAYYETIIEDPHQIKELSGMTIRNYFSDENGRVVIDKIPYDSYLIEVVENKNYSPLACICRVRFLEQENNKINKCFSLTPQKSGYTTIYVNTMIKVKDEEGNEKLEPKLIENSEVFINRCFSSEGTSSEFFNYSDPKETRMQLNENPEKKGIFDTILVPGKYLIEVNREGYEQFRKEIEITNGENKVDVELRTSKKATLKVSVYEFMTFAPLKNVLLKLNYSGSEEVLNVITNDDGIAKFRRIKEDDFYTVFATLSGYFTNQRTFVNKTESKNSVEYELMFIMVKEDYIFNKNCVVFISYSNLPGQALETDYSYTTNIANFLKIEQFDITNSSIVSNYIKLGKYKYI